jgi:hypothetical protein
LFLEWKKAKQNNRKSIRFVLEKLFASWNSPETFKLISEKTNDSHY